jgi:hypothetical protein
MRWAGRVARVGKRRVAYRVLVGKPDGKIPLDRPRLIWGIILKLIFKEINCGGVDWIDVAQDRDKWRALVDTVMNLRVP